MTAPADVVGERLDPVRLNSWGSRSFLPWTNDGALRLVVANAATLGLLITSWYLVSGETELATQTRWLELAIGGLVLSGVANGLWLLRGRRVVGLARVALLAEFERGAATELNVAPTGGLPLVAGERMTRFHMAACPLVAGKPVASATGDDHAAAGRRPCELCLP